MQAPPTPLRLGFAGLGWIGRHRMQALLDSNLAHCAAFFDPCDNACAEAHKCSPRAQRAETFDQLLQNDLDAIVIATPSALHAEQSIAALSRGLAVFCQKPLARTARETRQVIDAAQSADRLLGVDLSYRHTQAFSAALNAAREGTLGDIYAIDLTFHNAYGPDKPWFRTRELSGGGCMIDLGVHLLDLALLALDKNDHITSVEADLYARGKPLRHNGASQTLPVEDFAAAHLRTANGVSIRIACSWNLHAGQDAVIAADFYGDKAGALVRNVNGSFYDFEATLARGTSRETLATPPDNWGGRAAVAWAEQLARSRSFDPSIASITDVAEALDRIYARAAQEQHA